MADVTLQVNQQVTITLAAMPIGTSATWATSDPTIFTIDTSADLAGLTGMVLKAQNAGAAQLTVRVSRPGDIAPIIQIMTVAVVSVPILTPPLGITFGAPTAKT